MATPEELAAQLKSIQQTLVTSVTQLAPEQAVQRPEQGCWSVKDCVEHLYLVEKGIVYLLTKMQEQATEGDTQVFGQERMQKALLDRSRKINAPEAFVPGANFQTLAEALQALGALREKLIQALEKNQVRFDGFVYPHPVLGPFTRLDWAQFVLTHAMRHQAQIEEIKEKLSASEKITRVG